MLTDLNEKEKLIARECGKRGGQYLDKIKKYDVRELTTEQWDTFIELICYDPSIPF